MYRALLIFVLAAIPITSSAAVVVNEIAWMGTTVSANDEWIELYNNDAGSVDVTGWTLSDGVTLTITLTGTLPGNSYALLERTDDETVPAVTAFQVYTGALANDGRTLTLRNTEGAVVDQVVGGENWTSVGGDNVTKHTAQRTSSGWVTGAPTPGVQNIAYSAPPPPDEEKASESPGGSVKGVSATRSAGKNISLALPPAELSLSIDSPSMTYVNTPINLVAIPSGIGKVLMDSLVYTWNFGDVYTGTGKSVSHTFTHPGEYAVVLRGTYARHDTVVQKVVTVLPVTVSLSRTTEGDIVLKNSAPYDIDLGGYELIGSRTLVFPEHSVLLSGKTLTIDRSRVESVGYTTVALYDAKKKIVAPHESVPSLPKSDAIVVAKTRVTSPTSSNVGRTPAPPAYAAPVSQDVVPDAATSTASTTVAAEPRVPATIPLYAAAEGAVTSNSPLTGNLPYFGLVGIIFLGILGLYTKRGV